MIDTKALRQKILDMAIRGKLVPQDPNDEPASVLLERIRAEKQQLIKEGKIKKDKNDSVIYKGDDNRYYEKIGSEVKDITNEIDLECPRNWTFVRLRDLIELISGRDLLPTQYNSDKIGVPYITGASNLLNERIIINRWTDTPSVVSHKGDLLITCKGTIGEMVFNNIGDVHIARQIMSIRCIGVNSLFIMLVLNSYVSQLQSGAKSFIPGISRDDILKLPFIMPPLEEQTRIVNRVEELFAQIDIINQNQADIDTLYDEFRKRTLTLAIQGKLVPQNPNDEPASVLLKRIRAEKKAKLGKKYVDSFIYKGDDNCYYEKVETNEPVRLDYLPFDIPNSWSWVRLENAVIINPRNDLPDNLEVSFVEMKAISDGYNNHFSATTRPWKEVKSGFTHFQDGDVGFAKITPCFQNRKSVVFLGLQNGYGAGTTELHILRSIQGTILPKYLLCFVKSQYLIEYGKQKFSGTAGQQRFGTDEVKKTLLPLPPLTEQERIVKQVEIILEKLKDGD